MKIFSKAKVNLALDVLSRREDGYHNVSMIMQTIDLKDEICLQSLNEDKIIVNTKGIDIPSGPLNIVYKAAELIKKTQKIKKGVSIEIKKNIPVAAGLAGGSGNAAAIILGLNRLWNLNMTKAELNEIALKIGADVPYCMYGGTCLCQGIGEKLTKIDDINFDFMVLCKPDFDVSTPWVYKNLNLNKIQSRPDIDKLLKMTSNNEIFKKAFFESMYNVLQEVTVEKHPEIMEIIDSLYKNGAVKAMMSGSGPSVFAIFKEEAYAKNAYEKLKKEYNQTYLVKTSNRGIEFHEG